MKLFYIDLEQAESRVVGAIIYRLFGETAYLDACESADLHTLVCAMCWTTLDWPEEFGLGAIKKYGHLPPDMVKAAKKVAGQNAYRNMSFRDLAKRLGHGCLTEDHEVLTPMGWKPITDKPNIIMQYTGTKYEFKTVSNWIEKDWTEDLISFEGTSVSLLTTTDHRIIFTKDKNLTELPAEKFTDHIPSMWRIPLGSFYSGGTYPITPDEARLVAAYQSDGSIAGLRTRFHFHKQRKIDRLIILAENAGVYFNQSTQDSTRMTIKWTFHRKHPGAYMLQWPFESLHAYLTEYKYWDGHRGKTSVSLHSKHRKDLEWIQTLGRLCGIGGNIQKPTTSSFGTTMHSLQQNNRQFASLKSMQIKRVKDNNVTVYCPTVSSGMFLVRRNGKMCITGNSNYYGQPPSMARHTHVDVKIIKSFQKAYFYAFPGIKRWHRWVAEQLQLERQITTILGRRRFFFGRPDDDSTLREAIAYEPQSVATGDYMNLGLYKLWKANLPIHLQAQVHDAVSASYDEVDEHWIISHICKILETEFLIYSPDGEARSFKIPTEPLVGWNLSYASKKNPDGLTVFKGEDKRERTSFPPTSILNFKL